MFKVVNSIRAGREVGQVRIIGELMLKGIQNRVAVSQVVSEVSSPLFYGTFRSQEIPICLHRRDR